MNVWQAELDNPAWPPREYQGLIFDCDGTLTDSMPVHLVAWQQSMARYGIELSEARFYALGGMPTSRIIRMLAEEQSVTVDVETAAQEKEAAFVAQLPSLQPVPAVLAVARAFRGIVPMAVASGGFRDVVTQQLMHIGCRDWFATIVGAEDTTRHKPEPDVFLEAARRLGVPAESCLVYEDADLGVEAARRAGMDVVDIRKFFDPRLASQPDTLSNKNSAKNPAKNTGNNSSKNLGHRQDK